MIINNEVLNESMFNYQLEMINLRSSLEFDSAYVKYLGESDNIFIKIKDKIVAIIQRIINFIKDKLGKKTKEAREVCIKKASENSPSKTQNKQPKDLDNNIDLKNNKKSEEINKDEHKEEKIYKNDVYVVKDIFIDAVIENVSNFINKRFDNYVRYLYNSFGPEKIEQFTSKGNTSSHLIYNRIREFKEKGVHPSLFDPANDYYDNPIHNSSDMISYLKGIATRKDSPCVEAWIKDGKVTGEQTKKQKTFDRIMSKYADQFKEFEKLQKELTRILEKYKNIINKIDLTKANSETITAFNEYNNAILGEIDAHLGELAYGVQVTTYKSSHPIYM